MSLFTVATFMALLGLIAGILGNIVLEAFGIKLFNELREKYKKSQIENYKWMLRDPKLSEWLIKYYDRKNQKAFLYNASINGVQKQVPFIAKPSWYGDFFSEKADFKLSYPLINPKKIKNKRFINRRIWLGQNLWDGPLYSLDKIEENDNEISLIFGQSSYYHFVNTCGILEQETLNKVFKSSSTPIRDRYFEGIESVSECSYSKGVGVHCLLAIECEGKYKILLQERSHETVNYGGHFAVIPTFAYQPMAGNHEKEFDLTHQFYREYYEELLGGSEKVSKPGKEVVYNWFYVDPAIQRLIGLKKSGKLKLIMLGFGFDALNGEPNIALLVLITDSQFWAQEEKRLIGNWETDDIDILYTDNAKISDYLSSNRLLPGSAFTLSEGLKILQRMQQRK